MLPSLTIQCARVLTVKRFTHCIIRTVVLSYKIIGNSDRPTDPDAPPILLFHDLLGTKKDWDGLGKTIMNMTKRSVVSVDLRNHGDSPNVNSHTYEEIVEDVRTLYDKLAISKASLIGHGMGGMACMCLSVIAPQKVAGLLVVDTSPISTPRDYLEYYPKLFEAMQKVQFKKKKVHKSRKEAKKQLRQIIKDDILMKTVLSNINSKSDNTIGWSCNLDVLIKHFEDISRFPAGLKTKSYMGPTLFIGGQLSDFILPDDLTKIRQMFPRAVVKFIPKTTHYVHVDDSKTFLEHAIAFIKTNTL